MTIPSGSYVKLVQLQSGSIAVATYDQTSPGLFAMVGRRFCASYEDALACALQLTAKGYALRDVVKALPEKGRTRQ